MIIDELNIASGTVIDDKYQVKGLLGKGGMGVVYEATQTALERRVAIKILHHQYKKDKNSIERFHREARAAGRIGHDNICEVTDLGTLESGSPYLVMPLLQGHSLGELFRQRSLSLKRVVNIVGQTLLALEAAHSAGIVHRDLKPENLFVTRVGDKDDFIKLLDFGISKMLGKSLTDLPATETGVVLGIPASKMLGKNLTDSLVTEAGVVLGTPAYMAPEQATGETDIDHRVDIYAVGVILYEALTGARPFKGDSYTKILNKIVSSAFKRPSVLNPSIPKPVELLILKAMSWVPSKRYGSAVEMYEALQDIGLSRRDARKIHQDRDELSWKPIGSKEDKIGSAIDDKSPSTTVKEPLGSKTITPTGVSVTTSPGPNRRNIQRILLFTAITVGIVCAVLFFLYNMQRPQNIQKEAIQVTDEQQQQRRIELETTKSIKASSQPLTTTDSHRDRTEMTEPQATKKPQTEILKGPVQPEEKEKSKAGSIEPTRKKRKKRKQNKRKYKTARGKEGTSFVLEYGE